MEYTFAQYQESAQALRDRLGAFRPRCLLILGSGLGSLGNEVESPIAVPYEDVPHMKRSTARTTRAGSCSAAWRVRTWR